MSIYADYPNYDESASKILKLEDSIDKMKASVTAKGIYVPEKTKIAQLPGLIDSIHSKMVWDGDEEGGFLKVVLSDNRVCYGSSANALNYLASSTSGASQSLKQKDGTTVFVNQNIIKEFYLGKNFAGSPSTSGWPFYSSVWKALQYVSMPSLGIVTWASNFAYSSLVIDGYVCIDEKANNLSTFMWSSGYAGVLDIRIDPTRLGTGGNMFTFSTAAVAKGVAVIGPYTDEFLARYPNSASRNFYRGIE